MAAALAALAIAGTLPAHAAAAPVLERAEAALEPGNGPVAPASEPTVALRDLALRLDHLGPRDRRRAREILARPTSGNDPLGNNYAVPEEEPHCGAHFCVHYVASGDDAPSLDDDGGAAGVPDYVELVEAIAEQAYGIETGPLRWPAPKPDGSLGGAPGRIDIYLANVGGQGIFGYAAPDPPPAQRCSRRCHAYLVLDNDYSPAEFEYADPTIPLAVTAAHELNHVLQFGIDALQDGWLLESTAVWAEERVFPEADDWLNYIPAIAGTPGTPITDFEGANGLRVYGAAVWNHWLASGGGG
ncbi:MAG: MXAN_6640 family putative metalloprotease, partial [Solirubrobacterales bacterium]